MDLTNMKDVKAVDAADDVSKTDLQAQRKESSFPALKEWEMVLASGGEGAVIW